MVFLWALLFGILNFVLLYFVVRYLINKRVSSHKFVQAQEDMVNQLLVVMGETVDQNISLVEHKIKELKSTIDLANRRINLMEKERAKLEQSSQTYQELGKNRKPLVNSIIELKREEHPGSIEQEAHIIDRSSLHTQQTHVVAHPQESVEKPVPASPPVATPAEKRKESANYILHLFKQGKSPQEIASQMNMALAEVELIISMNIKNM